MECSKKRQMYTKLWKRSRRKIDQLDVDFDSSAESDSCNACTEHNANSLDFKSQLVSNYHFCYLNHVTNYVIIFVDLIPGSHWRRISGRADTGMPNPIG